MSDASTLLDARVIVAIDFGTTFSGFAFVHVSKVDDVFTNYDWPMQAKCGGLPYCKTITAVHYPASLEKLTSWGWPARQSFTEELHALQVAVREQREQTEQQAATSPHRFSSPRESPVSPASKSVRQYLQRFKLFPAPKSECSFASSTRITVDALIDQYPDAPAAHEVGHYLTRFKLLLAPKQPGPSYAPKLPPGLTLNRVVSDYLREMGDFLVKHLKKRYGEHMCKSHIQWCVTVPSIWDNVAKEQMKHCMELAGLVGGGSKGSSPFPPILVLEPEAASMYCYKMTQHLQIQPGDKFLVADIGGGTTDIVVQERLNRTGPLQVREVTESSGALCGGTHTDKNFIKLLEGKIGCLEEFLVQNASMMHILLQWWERTKCGFDGTCSADFQLPSKLARAWEAYDKQHGRTASSVASYDEIELSVADILKCFDPVVDEILTLISTQMSKCGEIKVMMVVGGFSASAYLMSKIRSRFGGRVQEIVNPPNPGSAVCQGAAMLTANKSTVVSRILKRTYGIFTALAFREGIDPPARKIFDDRGMRLCNERFDILARHGTSMNIDECVVKRHIPIRSKQVTMAIVLYSSTSLDPQYTTDKDCTKEGEIIVDMSDLTLDLDREVEVSVYFGRTSIDVHAAGVNFGDKTVHRMLPVNYVCDWM